MVNKSPRILVADDDLGVIAAYRYVLEGDEYAKLSRGRLEQLDEDLFGTSNAGAGLSSLRLQFVDQGEDAVKAVEKAVAESDPFTMIFLDVRMPPGLDGYETAALIRQIDPIVHIVFVSGYSDYTGEDLLEVGGSDQRVSIMPKPVWPAQLRSITQEKCSVEGKRA